MKVLATFLLTTLFLFADHVNWSDDLEESKARALKEGKPLLVMLSNPSCHVCNMMKEKVFTQKEVASVQNKYFVSVRLEMGFDDIPDSFEILGTPTFYTYDKKGKFIDKKLGGSTPAGWMKYLMTHK